MDTFFLSKTSAFSNYSRVGLAIFGFFSMTTIVIYLTVHLLLYQSARFQFDEIGALLQMIGGELVLTFFLMLILSLVETIEAKKARFNTKRMAPRKMLITGAVLLFFLNADAQTVSGTRHDAATGLQTNYLSLTTSKTKLVMNGEVLGHAQIPLGEKFTVLNEGVSGLTQRKGKVSVGCSLKITDEKGKVMLQMADLFADKDVFNVANAKNLKCIVSTGKPMKWDQRYNIKVVFWDKWGGGKITNSLTIETIDVP